MVYFPRLALLAAAAVTVTASPSKVHNRRAEDPAPSLPPQGGHGPDQAEKIEALELLIPLLNQELSSYSAPPNGYLRKNLTFPVRKYVKNTAAWLWLELYAIDYFQFNAARAESGYNPYGVIPPTNTSSSTSASSWKSSGSIVGQSSPRYSSPSAPQPTDSKKKKRDNGGAGLDGGPDGVSFKVGAAKTFSNSKFKSMHREVLELGKQSAALNMQIDLVQSLNEFAKNVKAGIFDADRLLLAANHRPVKSCKYKFNFTTAFGAAKFLGNYASKLVPQLEQAKLMLQFIDPDFVNFISDAISSQVNQENLSFWAQAVPVAEASSQTPPFDPASINMAAIVVNGSCQPDQYPQDIPPLSLPNGTPNQYNDNVVFSFTIGRDVDSDTVANDYSLVYFHKGTDAPIEERLQNVTVAADKIVTFVSAWPWQGQNLTSPSDLTIAFVALSKGPFSSQMQAANSLVYGPVEVSVPQQNVAFALSIQEGPQDGPGDTGPPDGGDVARRGLRRRASVGRANLVRRDDEGGFGAEQEPPSGQTDTGTALLACAALAEREAGILKQLSSPDTNTQDPVQNPSPTVSLQTDAQFSSPTGPPQTDGGNTFSGTDNIPTTTFPTDSAPVTVSPTDFPTDSSLNVNPPVTTGQSPMPTD